MTINSYIKKFGDFTIEERPLGPVDFIILAELSMISFDSLLNKNNVVKFKNIQEDQITPKLFEDSPDRRLNKKQLIGMINSKRFKDLEIRHVQRIFSETSVNQFYAITIVFPDGTFYISYRGTDITMVGWKEDFTIVLQDTFLGQEEAVEYLKDVINKEKGNFYIGGHSKGGNVALSASSLVFKDDNKIQRLGEAEIDLGGIAKGYTLDRAKDYLDNKGYKNYLIDGGSSSILLGEKNSKDGLFSVGLKDLSNSYLKLKNCFVSSSSISEQGVVIDNVTYSHIINPVSGSAINENDAVIVVSDTGYYGDAMSTSLMMNTIEEIKTIEVEHNIKTIVMKNGQIAYRNEGLEVYHR